MTSVLRGGGYLWLGLRLLLRPGIRAYAIAPLLINVVLFTALLWFTASKLATGIDALMPTLPDWLHWLSWLLLPLALIAALTVALLLCVMLATLIAAPFSAPLAIAVERHLRGDMSPAKESAMWLEVLRTLRDELRKLAYFGVRALPLLVLLVIPGINLIAAPLWLAFSAWMLALEYTEVPLANHGMSFVNIRQRVAAHRATSLGFGVAVLALTLVPGLQLLTIPAAVAGATAMVVREGMAQS